MSAASFATRVRAELIHEHNLPDGLAAELVEAWPRIVSHGASGQMSAESAALAIYLAEVGSRLSENCPKSSLSSE